ncbi:hypothetical protein L1987_17485 [Smallanthus sonchifolius]|uniref:Uncharacterized protein n=1 Tax=Smallanthus sonchifolius TaxID=185202 RepID=A0ACB9IYK1_9ASTR|nr:hypothetical protein L1987_17485 [Smallanthus sonchifolius]
MHETDPTQDSTGLLQRKCIWKKVKGKYDASPAHIAPSKSSTSFDNDTKEEKDFLCSSCARKFSCQQALAGHRNIHRGEWESLLDIPDPGKVDQCCELPIKTQASLVSNPISALKWQSSRNTSSMQRDASSTIHKPLLCAPQHTLCNPTNIREGVTTNAPLIHVAKPKNSLTFTCVHQSPLVKPTNNHKVPLPRHTLANPTYTLKGPSHLYHLATSTNTLKGPLPWHSLARPINILKGPSPTDTPKPHPLANPTNTLKGSSLFRATNLFPNAINTFLRPSLIAPQRPFFGSINTPHMPSIRDPNHPQDNCAKPHGKLALGVRYESMIHKPCQCRRVGQGDMLLRTSSLLFGTKQMMRGNIRSFGANSSLADLRSLLTTADSASTSRSEGGFSSKTHDLISSSFHPKGGKGIEANDLFPLTQALESHQQGIAHLSQGLLPQPDHNGEEVDLDLKL